MCVAVPAMIVEIQANDMAKARVGESETYIAISTMLLPDPPEPGDFVIAHAGFALHKMDPEEAQDSLAALREIAETACGVPANF